MNIAQKPIAVQGIHFYMFLVQDMKRARTFYESLFDLKPGAIDSEYFVEFELPDGSTFALARDPSEQNVPIGGAMFGVPDAEYAISRIEALGGRLVKRYGGEVCTSGWCTDTEGNAFGVHERK